MTTAEVSPEAVSIDDTPQIDILTIPMGPSREAGWACLRDAGRVVRVGETVWLTHRDDIVHALKHPEEFSSESAFDMLGSPLPLVPIAFDPPEHTRFRKILQPFFSPRALNQLLPALQAQVVDLVDAIAQRDECDAVAELAVPYPSQVFLTFFGLPLEDRDRLIGWKDRVIALANNTDGSGESSIEPAIELMTYLDAAVRERRENPGDDLLSKLLAGDSSVAEEPLDDGEALGLAFLFVLAGLDTVTAATGFALLHLAQRPDLRQRLRDDPDAVAEFIEEIVRLEPPAPGVPRMTTREVVVGGVRLPKDTMVNLALGAANREEGLYPDPAEIVMDGTPRKHWGFGGGAHRCLGSHLARIELKLIVTEWLRRIPEFEVVPGHDTSMPYPANTHGLHTLPLRILRNQ